MTIAFRAAQMQVASRPNCERQYFQMRYKAASYPKLPRYSPDIVLIESGRSQWREHVGVWGLGFAPFFLLITAGAKVSSRKTARRLGAEEWT